MMLRSVFGNGLRIARRAWLVVPLYLCLAVAGLALTWPLFSANTPGGLRNPFLGELARGGSGPIVDMILGLGNTGGPWLLSTVLTTAGFGLAYNFFVGGMLSAASGLRPFWAGCWRYLGANMGLGLMLVTLSTLLLVVVGVISALAPALAQGALLLALLLLQLLNVVGEYARAIAILRDRRNPFVLFEQAVAFCTRHFAGVVALAVLGLLLHALLIAVAWNLGTRLNNPIGAVLFQQLVSLGFLWVKLLRLAWAVAYVQAADSQQSPSAATSIPVTIG